MRVVLPVPAEVLWLMDAMLRRTTLKRWARVQVGLLSLVLLLLALHWHSKGQFSPPDTSFTAGERHAPQACLLCQITRQGISLQPPGAPALVVSTLPYLPLILPSLDWANPLFCLLPDPRGPPLSFVA